MSDAKNRRASRRLPPRGKVKVTCRKGGLDLGTNLAVSVLDISETGVRLVLRAGLPGGQEVSLTFESATSGRRVTRLANVIWCLSLADNTNCVGLHFQKLLRYAELDHLART